MFKCFRAYSDHYLSISTGTVSEMAAKTGKAADLDKELQALMELQEKLNMHAGLQQMVRSGQTHMPCAQNPLLGLVAASR